MVRGHEMCYCSEYPQGHVIAKSNKVTHRQELEKSTTRVNHLTEAFSSLHIVAETPVTPVVQEHSSSYPDLPSILLTHTLSNDLVHPNLASGSLPSLPPFSLDAAQASICAIINQPRHNGTTDLERSTGMPTSAASQPSNAWARKALNIIVVVERKVHQAIEILPSPHQCTLDNATLQRLLDNAAEVIDSAGRSLAAVKLKDDVVQKRKAEVMVVLRDLDTRVSQLGGLIPPRRPDTTPIPVDAAPVLNNPLEHLDVIAQITVLLGTICHVVAGLSNEICEFVINTATLLVRLAMTTGLRPEKGSEIEYNPNQDFILKSLPTSLYTALSKFDIGGNTTLYAACPLCNYTHEPCYDPVSATASFPERCLNGLAGPHGPTPCNTSLLKVRNGQSHPLKPFLIPSFREYLVKLLANKEIERIVDSACDMAFSLLNHGELEGLANNPFDAEFLRTFEGPVPGQLFIDRGDKVRLAFVIHVDFFKPNGVTTHSNSDSVGLISLALLNLPVDIRYLPENLFFTVIPGPREPRDHEINYYLRPIIDEFCIGWKRGFHISHTASSPHDGRDVEIAIALSLNDMPAARKVSGTAGHTSHSLCTRCKLFGRENIHDINCQEWPLHDVAFLRQKAEEWRDSETKEQREKIYKEHHIRWSELWRLPYWNPPSMLVVDVMHCLLEGLVHYHCRRVLEIDADQASKKNPPPAAFSYNWLPHNRLVPKEFQVNNDAECRQIYKIQQALTLPFHYGQGLEDTLAEVQVGSVNEQQLLKKLLGNNKQPLKFVCYSLDLLNNTNSDATPSIPQKKELKKDFADLLIQWRCTHSLTSGAPAVKLCSLETIRYIQSVIKSTVTPSWINSVPHNYGEASAGSIKAAEWRILSTVYLPIALVTLWGGDGGDGGVDGSPPTSINYHLRALDHTMALFQAVNLVCRSTMNKECMSKYLSFMKLWVGGLRDLYPHIEKHKARPNIHASLHVADFLYLYGPVMSWWCFPFERLIGVLQKVKTNDIVGGPLEQTILQTFMKGANIRWWLSREDCPEAIRQFKLFFDKAFSRDPQEVNTSSYHERMTEVAHIRHGGINFSRAATHLGNSLICYYPSLTARAPVAGSIQKITVNGPESWLTVKRQAPAPPDAYDPFIRYPSFPAQVYSSSMLDQDDHIPITSILCHVARFEFSSNRAVILNLSRA